LPYRGSLKDPLFPMETLQRLRPHDLGFPAWLTKNGGRVQPRRPGRPASLPVFAPNMVVRGGVLDVLRILPFASVAAVVCSPPYWGQRVYADEVRVRWGDGCLTPFGREESPEEYVAHTLEILKGLLPVLRKDGTIWWNVADSYMTRTIMRTSSRDRVEHYGGKTSVWANNPDRRVSYGHSYLKDKDLPLVPFQIAIGAQKLGYYARSVIVWSKQQAQDDFRDQFLDPLGGVPAKAESKRSHVPEIVSDRPVTGHEYILLLTKSESYQYHPYAPDGSDKVLNVRTVWTFPPVGVRGNHGARFPDELPRRCIKLATIEGDLVFDPFAGQGTTLRVARELKRRYFGCDISGTYVRVAKRALRLAPLLTKRTSVAQPHTNGLTVQSSFGR
jgi:DNA modification methylase